jgi:hypothetical protein
MASDAHERRALARQGAAGVHEERGADEVDGEDGAPVGHRGRHAGGVGHRAQRTELADARHEAGDAVAVRDVQNEGLDRGRLRPGVQLRRRRGQASLVAVDHEQDVDELGDPGGAGGAHPPPRPRHDADRHALLRSAPRRHGRGPGAGQ